MIKKYIKIIMISIFLCVLMLTPIVYNAVKVINGKDSNIMRKIDFDLNENRNYNEFKYNNIYDFPNAFDDYFNDHIPFRSFLIQGKRNIESMIEKPYINGIEEFLLNISKKNRMGKYQKYNVYGEKYMDYAVRQFTNHALMPWEYDIVSDDVYPLKTIGGVIIGKKNWFFLNSGNIEYYKGTNVLNEKQNQIYVDKLEKLDKLSKKKGKKIIYLMIPEKELIYEEYMPDIERNDEVSKLEYIRNYVASYSNINYIFAKEPLKNKKEYYRVYRKYDTHYNNVGAYIVHNEILNKDNKRIIDIDELKIDKIECKNKDLVWMSGQNDANYMDDFDYDIHYRNDIEVKQLYENHDNSGDVNRWIDIYESSINNEELLLFYGDSFKENIKSFLAKDYEKSVFLGVGNPKKDEILKNSIEAAKVIVIENAGRNEELTFDSMISEVSEIMSELPDVKNIE